MDVYDIDQLGRSFDYVLFMGVLYHLRHPLYALEKVAKVTRDRLIFQSMIRGSLEPMQLAEDYPITEREVFDDERFPLMYFVEQRYAGDPTNWWIPNRSGVEAILRAGGFHIDGKAGDEVYFCSVASRSGLGNGSA
jgi:tRNA (mo5U34)-methyltransferase